MDADAWEQEEPSAFIGVYRRPIFLTLQKTDITITANNENDFYETT